jgi:hypothetical protein
VVTDGVEVDVFDVNSFVFRGEQTEEVVFVEVRQFVWPELSIRADPPAVDFVSISEDDTGFFGDNEFLDFFSFGNSRKINFLEHKDILFRLNSLFKSFLFDFIFIIELFVLLGFCIALIFVDVLRLFVVRVIVVRRIVVVIFCVLLFCVHAL